MAIIQKEVELIGSKGEIREIVLFDSGSTYSCIRKDLAERLGLIDTLPKPLKLETAEEEKFLTVKEVVRLMFLLNGYEFSDEFIVVDRLSEKAITGAGALQKWRLKLDFEHDDIIIDPRVTRLRLL